MLPWEPTLRIAPRIGKDCSGQDILNKHCRPGQPTLRRSQGECHILNLSKIPEDRALQLFLGALRRLGVKRQEASSTKIGRLSATDLFRWIALAPRKWWPSPRALLQARTWRSFQRSLGRDLRPILSSIVQSARMFAAWDSSTVESKPRH